MLKKFFAVLGLSAALLSSAAFAAVDVNKASEAELDGIKGIGPAMSTRILEERQKAPFKDWDDFVSRVKGVGESTATKFSQDGLTVNGKTYRHAKGKGAKGHEKAQKADKTASEPSADAKTAAPALPAPATGK